MKARFLLNVAIVILTFAGCEDSGNLDFKEEYFIEGFLTVGEPIVNIRVQRSQPLTVPFQFANGKVTDATVEIFEGQAPSRLILLTYRRDETGVTIGDYVSLADTIKPETRYQLLVTFADGKTATAETTTPKQIAWIQAPKSLIQMPRATDKNIVPDSLNISWTSAGEQTEYLIKSTALDTLNYGIYLTPPKSEGNRRTWVETDEDNLSRYNSRVVWGFLQGTVVPTVWSAFKWYGKHALTLYAADENFANWFKLLKFQSNPTYDTQFSNVKGEARGIFGSASKVSQELFLLKESN